VKGQNLYRAIGDIDPIIVAEAENTPPAKRARRHTGRVIAAAACFTVVLVGVFALKPWDERTGGASSVDGVGEGSTQLVNPIQSSTASALTGLIGCDMTRLDPFTMSLLTNDEVIETNQDELGAQAAIVDRGPRAEVWAKPMSDGSVVFALVNTHRFRKTRITADFDSLGLAGRWRVRDLWAQKDLGFYSSRFAADVPPHATTLVRLFPQDGAGLAPGLKDIRHNSTYMQFREKRPVDKPGYMAPKGYPCAECPRERH